MGIGQKGEKGVTLLLDKFLFPQASNWLSSDSPLIDYKENLWMLSLIIQKTSLSLASLEQLDL
ncbi:uncharacterized protein EAE98_010384 [Botrytis deweyae]|uniref:Uncharacterized protein n=1 Tax=Botrytis deweyae TaxID=2478750 RepID=A0ABQ7I908_9HELO|nr:uncharacterized protein EAE98_010384 [Botrytis deweyae]KAF7916953.1 hypothetical protein EAE98_010384 [Botrytis deweyae]